MRNRDISITTCTIGGVATENALATIDKYKLESSSKYPEQLASPSDAALVLIKGGAQRWKDISYPWTATFVFKNLYHFFPKMYGQLIRYILA